LCLINPMLYEIYRSNTTPSRQEALHCERQRL